MTEKTIISIDVTVEKVKKQLNIEPDFTEDNEFIQDNINAAADRISGLINSDVALTNNVLEYYNPGKVLIIYEAPFNKLVSIKDSEGTDITDKFTAKKGFSYFELVTSEDYESLTIEFITGYETLPDGLKKAVIITAADLYDSERSNKTTGVSVSENGVINSLVSKYKRRYWG